ncbi:unnamed protein product, partial [Prorocentrum cordatum]
KNADLGIGVFWHIDQLGAGHITLRWVKAHTSWPEAVRRGMARFESSGNREADRFAKFGARLHPQLNIEVLERRWATSKAAAALLLRHHGE